MVLGGVAGSHLPNCRAHHGSGSRSLLDTDDSGSKLGYLVWREGYNVYQPTYVSLSVIQMEDTLSATYFRLVPPPHHSARCAEPQSAQGGFRQM